MTPSPETSPDDSACVHQWLARDPACPRRRRVEELDRFFVIRKRLLRHVLRDPRMWVWQGGNALQGLARYALFLGLFLALAPPVLVFWEPFLWPVADASPRLPLPAPEGAPTLWNVMVLCLLWLVMLDILLGNRLSCWRNIFVEKAERIAWAVVDEEAPPGSGTPAPMPKGPR